MKHFAVSVDRSLFDLMVTKAGSSNIAQVVKGNFSPVSMGVLDIATYANVL